MADDRNPEEEAAYRWYLLTHSIAEVAEATKEAVSEHYALTSTTHKTGPKKYLQGEWRRPDLEAGLEPGVWRYSPDKLEIDVWDGERIRNVPHQDFRKLFDMVVGQLWGVQNPLSADDLCRLKEFLEEKEIEEDRLELRQLLAWEQEHTEEEEEDEAD